MSRAAEMLAEFHSAFEVTAPDDRFASAVAERKALAKARETLHEEEHRELGEVLDRCIRFGTRGGRSMARELADVVIVAYGTAELFGIDLDVALERVHGANMAKLGPDGRPVKRPHDGKVMKPPGWKPPDLKDAVLDAPLDAPVRSYPDAITNPVDPPSVDGTNVTRPS